MPDGGVLRSTSLERCDLTRHDPDGTQRWSHRGRGRNCFQVAIDGAGNTWMYSQTPPISKYFARVDRNGTLRVDSEIVRVGFELVLSFAGDPLRAGLIVGGTLVFTGCVTAYITPALLGGPQVLMLETLLYQKVNVMSDPAAASVIAVLLLATTVAVNQLLKRVAR